MGLVEHIVALKRSNDELRKENLRLKHLDALPTAFGSMRVGSAFAQKTGGVFSGWLSDHAAPTKDDPNEIVTIDDLLIEADKLLGT